MVGVRRQEDVTPPVLPDVLDTERLLLRPWRFEGIDVVLSYASDADCARYLSVPQPFVRANAVEFVARQILSDRVVHPTMGDRSRRCLQSLARSTFGSTFLVGWAPWAGRLLVRFGVAA